jgi:hypothetical protein
MRPTQAGPDRRDFLQTAGAAAAVLLAGRADAGDDERFPRVQPPTDRPSKAYQRLAVVTTAYHYLSHAYHLCGRFLHGYLRDGKMHWPAQSIAAMYVEQQKDNDLSKGLARRFDFRLAATPAEALTWGKDKLQCEGVLLIGEHGDYPYNDKGQKLYPRYELFQKIVETFRKTGQTVPVFCDKHLSYDRGKAKEMAETARKMGFPLMAGSSLPVTWRRPELELPLGARIEEALVASRGELEIYGIHALEALQCMVERRAGGETGVKAVTCLEGDAVWKAGEDGVWSRALLEEALSRTPSLNVGDARQNCLDYTPPPGRPTFPKGPVAFVVEYRDGFKATALLLNGHLDDTVFAARLKDKKEPVSTLFYLPPPPGAGFLQALAMKVEDFFRTEKPPQPLERTLLTGGVLDWALESRVKKHQRLETPDLDIRYEPPKDSGFVRGEYNGK